MGLLNKDFWLKPNLDEQPKIQTPNSLPKSSPSNTYQPLSHGDVDEKLKSEILENINKKTPEISAFFSMLETFEDIQQSEATRYQTAFLAVQKTDSISRNDLLSSVEKRQKALETEISKFNEEMSSAAEENNQKRKQADKLAEQIASLQSQRGSIITECSSRDQELSETKATFTATVSEIREEISTEGKKIESYIQDSAKSKRGGSNGRSK